MANISFKSITFPGLANKYQVPEISNDLMTQGKAADAKATGDALSALEDLMDDEVSEIKADLDDVNERMDNLEPGLSDEAKEALLNCFVHVAWTDEHGQTYYNALENALYTDAYPKITVTYTPNGHIVFTDDTLNSLKPYITVTYYEDVESTGAIVPSTDYTLSGTLAEGINVVLVNYGNLSRPFSVQVFDFYNMLGFKYPSEITKGHIGNIYYASGIQTVMTDQTTTNRYFIGATRGLKPIREKRDGDLDIFPFPIPSDAVSVTVTKSDTNVWYSVNSYEWNGSGYVNSQGVASANRNNVATYDLTDQGGKFLFFVFGLIGDVAFDDSTYPDSFILEFN